MPESQSMRRRKPATSAESVANSAPVSSKLVPSRARRSWRFYVKWTARILIPITIALSNAKLVTIPNQAQLDSSQHQQPSAQTIVLLVITHSRANYLSRCLQSILTHHPATFNWPVLVSQDQQDGEDHSDVARVVQEAIRDARKYEVPFVSWVHDKSYDLDIKQVPGFVNNIAYRRISRHYYWALSRLFREGLPGHAPIDQVVIIEDDMEIAPDFFKYFSALAPLLESDPTLFCISAWNDNGISSLELDANQLHRTDFFPGLGWMLTRNLWEELAPKWPKLYWDDWMRSTDQTRGRQCIRPEVSRTANFGKEGVSQSFHFDKHVSKVVLGDTNVNFSSIDLSYLQPEQYRHMFFTRMSRAVRLKFSNYLTSKPQDADVIAFYPDDILEAIGKRTGIMIDDRNGIRRTSYEGVIVIPWNGHWAFIVARGWEPPSGYTLGSSLCC